MPTQRRSTSTSSPSALLQVVVNAGAVLFAGATLVAAGLYVAASAEACSGWLPLVMLANTLAASAAAAGPNRDAWMRRLLQGLWVTGALSLIWFVCAFVARQMYAWPGGWLLVGGHIVSILTVIVLAARRLSEPAAGELPGRQVLELDQRVTRLESQKRNAPRRRRRARPDTPEPPGPRRQA